MMFWRGFEKHSVIIEATVGGPFFRDAWAV